MFRQDTIHIVSLYVICLLLLHHPRNKVRIACVCECSGDVPIGKGIPAYSYRIDVIGFVPATFKQ